MKTVGLGIAATLLVLALVPFALVARSRASRTDAYPVHLVMDMDKQPKFKAQRATPMFADDRSMRPQVVHTVAREDLMIHGETLDDPLGTHPIKLAGGVASMEISDPATYAAVMLGRIRPAGMADEQFAALKPAEKETDIQGDTTFYVRRIPAVFDVSMDFMKRGQERFVVYCAPCHGESGYGDGMIARRAAQLQATPDAVSGWAAPQNLQEAKMVARPDGHLFNTITNGIRNMPAYDKQISIADRWAIVAYVRALERSQGAPGTVAKQ
jgi:hypothetical protein